jgi:hypothetical protein
MEIVDTRTVADFQSFTFSGHARAQVLKSLSEAIKLGHADYACFWTLELLCSGLVHSLWTTFFDCAASTVHRLCPNVFLYLTESYEDFANIESQYDLRTMTEIRNNNQARQIVCRVATTLALLRKDKLIALPKIKPEHDFQDVTVRENLRATTQRASSGIVHPDDPYELHIPINELCYHLQHNVRDAHRVLYWIAWIQKFASVYKKNTKQSLSFSPRPNEYVSDKYARHPVWLYWAAVWKATDDSPMIRPYVDALYRIHNLRWAPGLMKQRVPFLICAVLFVTEGAALNIHESAQRNAIEVEEVLRGMPRWLETILQTRDSFSSR